MNRVALRLALGLLVLMGWLPATPAVSATDLSLKTQLLWGTDEEKPTDATYKDVDPKLKKKLGHIFKWKHYFQISEQQVALGPKDTKRLKLSSKCELEVRFADEQTLEVKLFGEGKLVKTIRQSVKALSQGELSILAGDDKDKYGDAWFVVLSAQTP